MMASLGMDGWMWMSPLVHNVTLLPTYASIVDTSMHPAYMLPTLLHFSILHFCTPTRLHVLIPRTYTLTYLHSIPPHLYVSTHPRYLHSHTWVYTLARLHVCILPCFHTYTLPYTITCPQGLHALIPTHGYAYIHPCTP